MDRSKCPAESGLVGVVLKAPGAQEVLHGARQRQQLNTTQSLRPQLLSDLQPTEMRQASWRRCGDRNVTRILLSIQTQNYISRKPSHTSNTTLFPLELTKASWCSITFNIHMTSNSKFWMTDKLIKAKQIF